MRKIPPKCPYCKKLLLKVFESDYTTYVFDPESGRYDGSGGYLEMFCPNCDAKLYDVFPNGVCNYVSKKKHRERGWVSSLQPKVNGPIY